MNVVCTGDAGIDRYVDAAMDRPGGIALNVAVHLARLLGPEHVVSLLAPIGDDGGGRVVHDAARRNHVTPRLRVVPGATPVQRIRLLPSGERRFDGYHAGVLGGFRLDADERALVAASDLLTTTCFAQALDFFDAVASVPSRGLRAVDFTDLVDMPDPLDTVRRYAPSFDVAFFGLDPTQAARIDALDALARELGRLFVVTLGPAGSVGLTPNGRVVCPAAPAPCIVDTTGAGDTFGAGFLASFIARHDVAASLVAGSREAARSLAHIGAFQWREGDSAGDSSPETPRNEA